MKARKIWIAVHPQDSSCYEISFKEPRNDEEELDPYDDDIAPVYVKWQEHVCIPIETE